MKRIHGIALVLAIALPAQAQSDAKSGQTKPNEDSFSITLGAVYSTTSLTGGVSTRPKWSPLLDVSYQSGGFFASTSRGVGYDFVRTKELTVGAGLAFIPKREAAGNSRLRGMGDVAASPTMVLSATWNPLDFISVSAALTTATKRANGSFLTLGTSLGLPIYGKLNASVELTAELADRNYAQTYCGVTAAQSVRSEHRELRPKAGLISTSASVGLHYEWTKEWSLGASLGTTRLQCDAAKSPIFSQRTEPNASLFASYAY